METSPCLSLLCGTASDNGVKYELKIAALLQLRARKLLYKMRIYRSVAVARPLDDLVLHLSAEGISILVFVQLKHAEGKDIGLDLQAFCPKKKVANKHETGDFNLRKYFKFYELFHSVHELKGAPYSPDLKLLSETPLNDVWFLIYTNKVVKRFTSSAEVEIVNGMMEQKEAKIITMLEKLLGTNPTGRSFRFDNTEGEVWNQMDDNEGGSLYQEKFLPRMLVFHKQSHVSDLNELILQEITEILGSSIPLDTSKLILDNFLQEMQAWASEPEGQCLSENSSLLERAVAAELRRRAREAAGSGALVFDDNHCAPLADALSRRPLRLRLAVNGTQSGLRAAKLLQVLDSDPEIRNAWTYVSERTLDVFPLPALKTACQTSDVIVVDMEQAANLQQFERILEHGDREQTLCVFCSLEDSADLSEHWTLEQLKPGSQEVLLQRTVNFQGEDMSLSELESAWPTLRRVMGGTALNSLVAGRPLILGATLPPMDPFYVPRIVQHRSKLRHSILQLRSDSDYFVLKDFPPKVLQQLRLNDSPWEECSSSWEAKDPKVESRSTGLVKTKWKEWESDADFDCSLLLRGRRLCIHQLVHVGEHIIWDKSTQNTKVFHEYMVKESEFCQTVPVCSHSNLNHMINWYEKRIILADVAGMGKSTFVVRMAHTIKAVHKNHWVVVFRINDGNILESLPENMTNNHISDILYRAASPPQNKQPSLLKYFLQESLNKSGHIVIFVDGVDEVCPAHKKKALRLLKLLDETLQRSGGRLWVAARTVLEVDLTRVLSCPTPLSLKPFSKDGVYCYLLKRWESSLKDVDERTKHSCIETLVDAVRKATACGRTGNESPGAITKQKKRGWESEDGSSLCDVPLYTRMLADACTNDEIGHIMKGNNVDLHLKFDVFYIYKRFVNQTVDKMWEKDGITASIRYNLNITSDSFMEIHKKCAALKCFNDKTLLGPFYVDLKRATEQVKESSQMERQARTGLISKVVDGEPSFIHHTITEFMAAWWLFDNYAALRPLTELLYQGELGECRYFFDAFLAEGCPMHEAALAGRLDDLDSTKLSRNEDGGGRHPLHLAAIVGNAAAITRLLETGGNVVSKDQVLGWTALRYADAMIRPKTTFQEEDTSHLQVADLLLEAGGRREDVPGILNRHHIRSSILRNDFAHLAKLLIEDIPKNKIYSLENYVYVQRAASYNCHKVLIMLLKNGFPPDLPLKQRGYRPALHLAAIHGSENACRILLEHGANVNATDFYCYTALMLAASEGQENICRILLTYSNINPKNTAQVLVRTSSRGYGNVCQPLINARVDVNAKDQFSKTALIYSASEGNYDICQLLLQNGAKIDKKDLNKTTALIHSANRGHSNVCKLLLDNNASINEKDAFGKTAMHYAARNGHFQICKHLIEYGTDINIKDDILKHTPLHHAANKTNLNVCSLLIDNTADINIPDENGQLPLHHAASYGDEAICKVLVENGADILAKDYRNATPLHHASWRGNENIFSILVDSGSDINSKDIRNETSLHLAAYRGHISICKLLIERGIDIRSQNRDGDTPLHQAAAKGRDTICVLLIEHGADVQMKNKFGETALHFAASENCMDVCKLLVQKGADINDTDLWKRSPLHYAQREGYDNVCNFLLDNGAINLRSEFL